MVDINEEMAQHARAAAEMVLEEYGHEMDFSEPTIGAVESLLSALHDDPDDSSELYAQFALLFGAYIGEMIRAHYPDAIWIEGSLTLDAPPPLVRVGHIDISPIVWCFKRLHNGPAESVVTKYLAFRDAAGTGEGE